VNIPLVDLGLQRDRIAAEVEEGFARVLATTAFIGGPDVTAFEEEFAAFTGTAHCVGVANGTDALELAMRAAGVRDGDHVALPANTFVATAEAVVRAGGVPVPVDVDPVHLLLDPGEFEKVAPRCQAVLPVHLFGQLAPMNAICAIAEQHGVQVVEDAAQCQGATQNGTPMGGFGVAAATSFYPGKNLGAFGDAGAVVTDDAEMARKLRLLANHGSDKKYSHPELGFNSRLDTLQAVVLRAKLKQLSGWNTERAIAADTYAELLADVSEVRLPGTAAGNEHVWHLYVVRVRNRDEVLKHLNDNGVGAGIHYPTPVHRTGAFAKYGRPEGYPVAELGADEILSLPLFPGITPEQQARVAALVKEAVALHG
jgi:dTDP-4-amino-4,6-dideoxygalactose transaminase